MPDSSPEKPAVLLTGFEPFADAPVNPSWDAVSALAATWDGPGVLVTERLPVEFGRASAQLRAALDLHRPTLVLSVGLAEGRTAITPERVAVNLDDARIPDNAGRSPLDEPVEADGPAAYFTTLPVKAIVAALQRRGIPASVSSSAGTYVCNHVFYALQHALAEQPEVRSGFVHVPATPETRAGEAVPTLPLEVIVAGLGQAVTTALETVEDLRAPGGSIS